MKKSSIITLVLVSSFVSFSCQKKQPKQQDRLYLRSDSSGSFTRMHPNSHGFYPYYLFRSYGTWDPTHGYHRNGFSSGSIHSSSNSFTKVNSGGHVTRGGFGHSSFSTGA